MLGEGECQGQLDGKSRGGAGLGRVPDPDLARLPPNPAKAGHMAR
jgi:hypothetical protein